MINHVDVSSCGETVDELGSCVCVLCVCLCREADSSVADYGPLRGLSRQRPCPVGNTSRAS